MIDQLHNTPIDAELCPEPEFLNIQWKPFFKGQSVQQGLQ